MTKLLFGLALSILLTASAAQEFDPMSGVKEACKPHVCSEGYQPVPKLPLNFTSSGCNSIGGISTFRMEARHEPGLPCCHMRAACYQICGMSMKKCDDIFKKCNDSICDSIEDEAVKEKCVTATSMHNMLAGMMDCGPFEHQQHNNCGCMEKSKALSWNKKVIHEFYAKYARHQLDKAENLGAKADTTSNLANLMLKLIQKYPKSIAYINDPGSDAPKEMGMDDFDNYEF